MMVIFPSALEQNDFHISVHPNYGIHFKTRKPVEIQSEPIRFEELIKVMETRGPKFINDLIRLPRGHHNYYLFLFTFNQSGIKVKSNENTTRFALTNKIITDYQIRRKGDSFFIPRDFENVLRTFNSEEIFAFVPGTGEFCRFIPAGVSHIQKLSETVEEIDLKLSLKMKGFFLTYKIEEASSGIALLFPSVQKVIDDFIEQLMEARVIIYNEHVLTKMPSLFITR